MSKKISTQAEIFSTRLKRCRQRRGISQELLAEQLGISKGTVGNWETGAHIPGPGTLRRLALLLEQPIDFLLGEDPPPQKPPDPGAMALRMEQRAEAMQKLSADIAAGAHRILLQVEQLNALLAASGRPPVPLSLTPEEAAALALASAAADRKKDPPR